MNLLPEMIQRLMVEEDSTVHLAEMVQKLTVEEGSVNQLPATKLTVEDALCFMDKVKGQCDGEKYEQFVDILKAFKAETIDIPGVMIRVASLFSDHQDLVKGFHKFLPEGYTMELRSDNAGMVVIVAMPNDRRNIYVIKRADGTINRASM